MNRVVDLADLSPDNATAIGGAKIGRLVEMGAAGSAVPLGFVLGVDAYRDHFRASGLDAQIDAVLDEMPSDPTDADIDAAAERICALVRRIPIDPALEEAIADHYARLCSARSDPELRVAVRSSATGEDGQQSSFAGMFDTYLGVSGAAAVVAAVRDCWASLFCGRALRYRYQRGISHQDMPMAVGVLELIKAKASGVAFSLHPVSGKADRIVIEGSWGWGEAVVQGLVTPDRAEVGKTDLRVLRYSVATKQVISDFDLEMGRVVEKAMPDDLREARVLDEEELTAIADAVRRIEKQYGHPVDVEWVVEQDRRPLDPVHIVQSRPVTVQSEAEQSAGWDSAAFATKFAFQGGR